MILSKDFFPILRVIHIFILVSIINHWGNNSEILTKDGSELNSISLGILYKSYFSL